MKIAGRQPGGARPQIPCCGHVEHAPRRQLVGGSRALIVSRLSEDPRRVGFGGGKLLAVQHARPPEPLPGGKRPQPGDQPAVSRTGTRDA